MKPGVATATRRPALLFVAQCDAPKIHRLRANCNNQHELKTFPAASNFAFLFRLYRWAATLAAIHFKISRKENTGMKIKTNVKAGVTNVDVFIGSTAK